MPPCFRVTTNAAATKKESVNGSIVLYFKFSKYAEDMFIFYNTNGKVTCVRIVAACSAKKQAATVDYLFFFLPRLERNLHVSVQAL